MNSLFVRIRRRQFFVGLALGVCVLCLMVRHTLHMELGAAASSTMVRSLPHDTPPPVAHAHEGWLIIRAWEHAMDSLRQDVNGRRRYDSILAARPGILDSARKAEAFYYSQDQLK